MSKEVYISSFWTIFSEWHVLFIFFKCLLAKEDGPKFFEVKHIIVRIIMLFNNLSHFFYRYFLTKLLHSKVDVIWSDVTCVVSIELLEDSSQPFRCTELLDINCCREEFTVVDLFVTEVVNFLNN